MSTQRISWKEGVPTEGVNILSAGGGAIVSPTKVGYIVMTSDRVGLERKFEAKQRKLNKPGVVLCSSMEQLRELAELNGEIEAFYQTHWDNDILLGCILPWKDNGRAKLPDDGCTELMMDKRGTTCFVIKFGKPSEMLAKELWEKHGKFVFASSANPSGQGNRGRSDGIGERIENAVDLIIDADDYVESIQPDKTVETRYEQGVMVSMVDADGKLIPEQKGERSVTPAPVLIRKGLDNDKIMANLAEHFNSWDYRHGEYY
ncbi:MAG: translation factor (SUA5) [Proteobacteria bacterium]|nr:MAG: translation factor (SUA5) [Pseudomonadota bacterium]